jgi:hypothetical protein
MNFEEIGWDGVDWIGLAQDRDRRRVLVNAVLHLRVPYNAGKLPSGYTAGGLTSGTKHQRISEYPNAG